MKKNVIVLAAISALMFAACAQKENQPGGVEVTPEIVGEDCNEFISFAGDTYTYSFKASHQWLVTKKVKSESEFLSDYDITLEPEVGDAGDSSIKITFPANESDDTKRFSITISLLVNGSSENTVSKTIEFTVYGKLPYNGDNYKVIQLQDGNSWMAENLRYVPEGVTPSDDASKTYKMWYPYSSNGTEITVLKDEESIKKLGYLYNPAFALGVSAITAENYNQLEGVRGICPEGWHIPTRAEYIGLCGFSNKGDGETTTITDNTAVFWDTVNGYGSIGKANEEGFNYTFCGCINNNKYQAFVASEKNCSVDSYFGNTSLNYHLCSTGVSTTNKNTGEKTYYTFGLMSTFTLNAYPLGRLSLANFNLAGGAGVRCVKDHKDAPIEGGNEDSI